MSGSVLGASGATGDETESALKELTAHPSHWTFQCPSKPGKEPAASPYPALALGRAG